jgi:Cof subfamily protein (haloacid dehalogenase superfamily)
MTAIRLLLAGVEGALLTPDEALTPGTEHAVGRLRDANIELAITSGRPPRAMRTLIDTLRITAPVCGFDGGMLVRPDLSLLEQHVLGDRVARAVIASMERHALEVWVYQGDTWLVRRPDATHVTYEEAKVQFAAKLVDRWDNQVHDAVKIAGFSDDTDALARCEADLWAHRAYVSVVRSRPCSVAVTHPRANTGELVRALSRCLGIPRDAVAAIGRAPNDVLMFRECGLAIAMGQAGASVQRLAHFITRSNAAEGFAYAVETWILKML